MRRPLHDIAPAFVTMAHAIGVGVAATVGDTRAPSTRMVQPVWTWDGSQLTGWLSTDTRSPKYDDLQANPTLSLTYWNPDQDTCTANSAVDLVTADAERAAAWERFLAAPAPAGFDPAIHPDWDDATAPTFGVVRLRPMWLRVMPGSLMTRGEGEVWTWRAP